MYYLTGDTTRAELDRRTFDTLEEAMTYLRHMQFRVVATDEDSIRYEWTNPWTDEVLTVTIMSDEY